MNNEIKLWIDAIDFAEKGGWKVDTQYVHLMGCGYLIAANEPGIPVEDAKTTVTVPQKDTYRIGVRDRNWLRPHNPGTFSLLVNGQDNGVVLGRQPSDAWVWEIAGDFEMDGATELTVRDLTGYFGRFSSIVITNDFDYVPSREIERMRKERADLVNPGTCANKFPFVPKCVKDYTVELFDGTKWIKIADEKDNFLRKRIHGFDAMTVEKIRVTVLATGGDKSARIMEIRAQSVSGNQD